MQIQLLFQHLSCFLTHLFEIGDNTYLFRALFHRTDGNKLVWLRKWKQANHLYPLPYFVIILQTDKSPLCSGENRIFFCQIVQGRHFPDFLLHLKNRRIIFHSHYLPSFPRPNRFLRLRISSVIPSV